MIGWLITLIFPNRQRSDTNRRAKDSKRKCRAGMLTQVREELVEGLHIYQLSFEDPKGSRNAQTGDG